MEIYHQVYVIFVLYIQILDLSMNSISADIPSCIKNLTSVVEGDQVEGTIWMELLVSQDTFLAPYEVSESIR